MFKDATKIQISRQRSTPIFFVCAKTQHLVRNYSHFTITFLTIKRCAGDFFKVFLKMLPKFKLAARGQLQFFLCAQKLNTKSEIIQILQSHPPRYGDVQVMIFLRFCNRCIITQNLISAMHVSSIASRIQTDSHAHT